MNKLINYLIYFFVFFSLIGIVYYCFNSLGYLPNIKIPLLIFIMYFIYSVLSYSTYISYKIYHNTPYDIPFPVYDFWSSPSLLASFGRGFSLISIFHKIAFIAYYAYKINFISAILLFLTPIIPVYIASLFTIRLFSTNAVVVKISIVIMPIFLGILFFLVGET